MAEPILLRQGPATGQVEWLDLASRKQGVRYGALRELAALAQSRSLVLVWPAASVLLLSIELPLRNSSQIAKALPFALEDQLADDVDNYHLVWQRQPGTQRIAVAAVGHQTMAANQQLFLDAGLVVDMALPEPLLLPWQSGQSTLLLDGGQAVFRYDAWLGGGGERELSMLLLQRLYESGQALDCLQVWSRDDDRIELAADKQQQKLEAPLSLYAEQWSAVSGFNLLKGPYAPKSRTQVDVKRWLPAATVVLMALLVQLGGQWQLVRQQRQQLRAAEAQSRGLFQQTFPEIKRLVNLKAQADQQLLTLQQAGQVQTGFLSLLYRSGNLLKENPQLKLQRLKFADGSLQLQLQASDVASVEQFKHQLSGDEDLQVEVGESVAVKAGVEAKLDVRKH